MKKANLILINIINKQFKSVFTEKNSVTKNDLLENPHNPDKNKPKNKIMLQTYFETYGVPFTTYSLFMDIQNSFLDIQKCNSFFGYPKIDF